MNKIFYLGIHPPHHSNIGDFSQVIGIQSWFNDYFPSWDVIIHSKRQVLSFLSQAESEVDENDLIFIHSGGDMGDRYLGWERIRLKIVKAFPKNKIISLPQTIHFSKSENLEGSARIYNSHPDLTIMARDEPSYEVACKHFDQCKVMLVPDFALYLKPPPYHDSKNGILVCLRADRESALDKDEREKLFTLGTPFDTSVGGGMLLEGRREQFEKTMEVFQRHEVVVTDRFHGMIFAHLAQTPCIVLSTKGHKVTAGTRWFGNQIQLAKDFEAVQHALKNPVPVRPISWSEHFVPLKSRLFHGLKLDYRDGFQLIKHRRSIRRWKHYPVEEDELRLVLEAGAMSPTGANDQRVRFLPVRDPDLIKKFCDIKLDWTPRSNPTVVIFVLFDLAAPGRRNRGGLDPVWGRLFWQDTAAAMENMMLMAESLGLSTCWVTLAMENRVARIRELFQINDRYLIACTLFLGYGDQKVDYEAAKWCGRPLKRDLDKMVLELGDLGIEDNPV